MAAHERLTYFTRARNGPTVTCAARARATRWRAMTAREPVTDWIIDDTGFPKQGTHSVGVQRQYSGTIGKIANCQVAASLTIATRTEHVPVDFALYLPESWTEIHRGGPRPTSRRGDVQDQAELGVEMIERAIAELGCRAGLWVLAADKRVMATTPSSPARALARVGAYAVGLHPYDHGVAPGFAGTPNR